jgi:alcohol dehydrogenase
MRQLSCTAKGRLEWRDVAEPELPGPQGALVRPIAVARCEIDPLLISAGPVRAPEFAVGHEAIAEVVAVGPDVAGVHPGDLAAVSFQLSCGTCGRCRAGRSANCERYPILSDYGMEPLSGVEYGGMLADLVAVPHAAAMLVPIPAGLDPAELASAADNIADGYRAVAPHLRERPGAPVLIACHGVPAIASYAAQVALALGSAEVTFASEDKRVLDLAAELGATALLTDWGRRPGRWPIVVDCGTSRAGLRYAISCCEPDGILQSVSYYPAAGTDLPLGKLYTLGIAFHIGRVHSAAVTPAVVELAASGAISPGAVTTKTIAWDESPDHYLADAVKLVVTRA